MKSTFTPERSRTGSKGTARAIAEGSTFPLGAHVTPSGVNFSVFSKHATGLDLLLFDRDDDARPARVIPIDAATNRHYHYWHVFVPGLKAGQLYAFRAAGPFDPANGHRFDAAKILLDPYGRGVVVPNGYDRQRASVSGDNSATAMKSVVVDPSAYDWQDDRHPHTPSSQTIVYEMHVRGMTRHPSSGVSEEIGGTYRRTDREDPVPAGAGRDRRRAAARLPIRRAGGAAR